MSNEILKKSKESFHALPAPFIEMNEVIAVFDGRKSSQKDGYTWWSDTEQQDKHQWLSNELRYHSDWAMIMGVGKKCRETLESFSGDLLICGFGYMYKIYESLQTFNTWKVHEATYNYIVWYNKSKGL